MEKVDSHNKVSPNIFKTLLGAFLIVPIIPIIMLSYLSHTAESEAEKQVEKNIIGASNIIAEDINSWLEKNLTISRVAAESADFQSLNIENIHQSLKSIKQASPTIIAARVDNKQGQAIARSDDKPLKDYSDRDYFQAVKAGEPIGQQVIFGKNQKKPIFCFSVPIKRVDAFVGAIVQCASIEDISSRVTNLKISKSGYAFLVDNKNKLLATGKKGDGGIEKLIEVNNNPILDSTLFNHLSKYSFNGDDIVSYKQKVGLDWTLVVLQNVAEAYATPISVKRNAIITIVITLVACLIIVAFISRIVSRPLQRALDETDNILSAVNDGLFLIDKQYIIGSKQSSKLKQILRPEHLVGKNFVEFLNQAIPKSVAKLGKDYINLLFEPRIIEKLTWSINPLKEVPVTTRNKDGEENTDYLSITFKRIYNEGQITHLLVTIKDITREIKLNEALNRIKEEKAEKMQLLSNIIHIPMPDMTAFIDRTLSALEEINRLLEEPTSSKGNYLEKITSIFQIIHTMKSDASLLDFEQFVQDCHNFENILLELKQNKVEMDGDEFLPAALALEKLFSRCQMVEVLINQLNTFKNQSSQTSELNAVQKVRKQLFDFSTRLADKYNKPVDFHFAGEEASIATSYLAEIKAIFTQLIRNSFVHGFESQEERRSLSKAARGHITISLSFDDNGDLRLVYRDDGRGLDYQNIETGLVENNSGSVNSLNQFTDKDLQGLLFINGSSTARSATVDGGRGVGMSLVLDIIDKRGGQMSIDNQPGQYLRFDIVLPYKNHLVF